MLVGKVKWFDVKKGFGFIEGEEGADVFVHYTAIEGEGFRSLIDSEWVHYEMTRGLKGFLATVVRRVSPDGQPQKKSPLDLDVNGHPGP